MWIYICSERSSCYSLYTVGFYNPKGEWQSESDYGTKEEAAARVHYLNGGKDEKNVPEWLSQALNEGDGTYNPQNGVRYRMDYHGELTILNGFTNDEIIQAIHITTYVSLKVYEDEGDYDFE
jgi:hypothetical protein